MLLKGLKPRLATLGETKARWVSIAPHDFVGTNRKLIADACRGDELSIPNGEYELKLIGRRQLRSYNYRLCNIPTMVKAHNRRTALLQPTDAGTRGLIDGEVVLRRIGIRVDHDRIRRQ